MTAGCLAVGFASKLFGGLHCFDGLKTVTHNPFINKKVKH